MPFNTLLQKTGLVAILRGVKPDEIVAIGEKLYAAGFRLIEIPMNSPEALQSISLLRDALPKDCLVGAGTVLSVEQVVAVKRLGPDYRDAALRYCGDPSRPCAGYVLCAWRRHAHRSLCCH